MKRLILILTLLFTVYSYGQELEIGVMRAYSSSKVQFTHLSGNYTIYGDSLEIGSISESQNLIVRRSGEKVKASLGSKDLGSFDVIHLKEVNPSSSLKIQTLSPSVHKLRKYKNNFKIFPEDNSYLTVVNMVEMDNYLSGVIESEGGGGKDLEYYKVQAILSRTYALDHLYKHHKEGFSLCDRVHCQAYHNMLRFTPTIGEAVTDTKNMIMVGPNLKLAKAFFFANCGGQTSESDFVWNKAISYCKSVQDTFCVHSRQATWTKKIKAGSWRNYLVNHFGYPVHDSLIGPMIYHFKQESRHAFYLSPQLGIPLRDLRSKFKLKSTWFSTHLEGEYVVLEGHGFGHGVGLCQEGAMRMARLGYNYDQILNFYFTGIDIMNYHDWTFLMQDSEQLSVGL